MNAIWKMSVVAGLTALLAACGGPEDGELLLGGETSEDEVLGLVAPEGGVLGVGILLAPGAPEVSYLEVDGELLLEGDILLAPDQLVPLDIAEAELAQRQQALLSVGAGKLWPNGVIRFVFEAGTAVAVKDRVKVAMAAWEASTPIRFVKWTSQTNYVTIRVRTSDYAHVGRIGGQQLVTIRSTTSAGVIMHELGHTIGLWHEHTRPDRNNHVKVHWANVKPGMESAFQIVNAVHRDGYHPTASPRSPGSTGRSFPRTGRRSPQRTPWGC